MTWAIVLAGSLNNGKLKDCSKAFYEALITIGNKFMVEYVVEALEEANSIDKIVVVGPQKELNLLYKNKENIQVAKRGDSIFQSIVNGLAVLEGEPLEKGVIVTSDIPLIKPSMIDEFVLKCLNENKDLCYPIVPKAINDEYYPNVKRTYVNLKDGVFTGGNMFLINPSIIRRCEKQAEELIALRKSPFKLVNYIGFKYIIKYFLRNLEIEEAEKRVGELLDIEGKAIILERPEIGIDIDKPSDLELAKEILVPLPKRLA